MEVTVLGMVMDVNEEQFIKASLEIVSVPSGNSIDDSLV
jgi:hypothetical protein